MSIMDTFPQSADGPDEDAVHKARELIAKHLSAAVMEAMRLPYPDKPEQVAEEITTVVQTLVVSWKGVIV